MTNDDPPAPTCTHCGATLSRRGRTAPDGSRYCSGKRACIRARDRARYARRFDGDEVGVEDRPCSHCGAELPVRPKRPTDDPRGRWCRDKSACRRAKALTPDLQALRTYYAAMRAIHQSFFAAAVVTCLTCQYDKAREGHVHRAGGDREAHWCSGTGTKTAPRPLPALPPDGEEPCDCRACEAQRQREGISL